MDASVSGYGSGSAPKDNASILLSPFSSPNVSALLKIKIISWSQETGLPASVCVHVADRIFNLHKYPLFLKSGFFKRKLSESNEIELPRDFPGGPETFEMISLFIYGSSTLVDPFNVAALRCAAEFLEMTEEYGSGNLCERFDIYLNQVVLQSWEDTLIVLQQCRSLVPWAEELLIVSRCIESLAFMACMEILDPERRRDQPVITLETLSTQRWSSEMVQEFVSQDVWIKDLIALPFGFFKRVIGSLRRQGMKEKFVSPVVLFYANWVLSDKNGTQKDLAVLLTDVLDLLQMGEKGSRVIPVGFYFILLSRSLKLNLDKECTQKLQNQISGVLHMAQVEDFLLPESGIDDIPSNIKITTMETIFSTYVLFNTSNGSPSPYHSAVAELWDSYLTRIASDPEMGSKRFMELIEIVPTSSRQNHDHLYRALNIFLQMHPELSQDEKSTVCKYLNCQKLSHEVCVEAVQNELMPLRLIVQALFVQQLSTHKALKECSDSFRYAHCGDFSGSLPSSRYANSRSQNLVDSPCIDLEDTRNKPLSFLLQTDLVSQKPELCSEDYESTSFRIQTLEQQLMTLKRSLQLQNTSKKREQVSKNVEPVRPYGLEGRTMSKKRTPLGQVTSCIGTVNFASQRKYASRLLKVFRRFSLFGRTKPKRKPSVTGLRPKSL
ncbi:hypothetical protein L6452_00674 [Arctium lappa]|uniref:Uncharacterized protein n=1 Tax=Arctium lappa TaxID=4217 RepID=A0ACB9FFD1_ARCLA|nr:hypothetical protein L6452_00674 [Arctium lappa]